MISMNTPIYDFVNEYIASKTSRLHMPGHKGQNLLGCEDRDLTEITGADDLFQADGIIAESEKNAARLFGTYRTFYSTEGSSHVIRAMLMLASSYCPYRRVSGRFTVLAARNVHKAFISACAMLDLDVEWLYPESTGADAPDDSARLPASVCSCPVTPERLRRTLLSYSENGRLPDAVYITSPDYLGGVADIRGLAGVCDRFGLPLLVDNAHGAYLHFLETPAHPMDLGAAMCCDSAHKTLPALTGGAYLHISDRPGKYSETFSSHAREALSVFGTSSPSYLILQSLDLCNLYLAEGYKKRLDETIQSVNRLKQDLQSIRVPFLDTEPLKLVLDCAPLGLSGDEAAAELREHRVECEYHDAEYLVLMFTPENRDEDFERILTACKELAGSARIPAAGTVSLKIPVLEKARSIREALLGPSRVIPSSEAAGKICAVPTVSCPPAVPIAVSGERFNDEAVRLLEFYGIREVSVMAD